MRVAGSLYTGSDFTALALYNSYDDIYSALPQGLKGEHVSHVKYGYQSRRGSIDIYILDSVNESRIKKNVRLKNIIKPYSNGGNEEVRIRQNVKAECVTDIKGRISDEILDMSYTDIDKFCRTPAKKPDFSSPLEWSDKITPVTMMRFVKPSKPISSGKSDYVDCIYEANYDFGSPKSGCVSSFVPFKGPIFFDDRSIKGYYYDRSAACEYCYAEQHQKEPFPKVILRTDMDWIYDILMSGDYTDYNGKRYGKHVNVLRLGKRTEPGSRFFRDELLKIMDVCIRSKTDLVIPTKFLEFDEQVAAMCLDAKKKDVDFHILHSTTYLDGIERGACENGFSNEFRKETNKQYRSAGVHASLYLMTELVYDLKGKHLETILETQKDGNELQLLGARVTKKSVAEAMTGRSWAQLKGNRRTESHIYDGKPRIIECGGYALTGNTQLSPQDINPTILALIGNNKGQIRLCHHNKKTEYCGSCFLCKGFIKDHKKKEASVKKYNNFNKKKIIDKDPTLDFEGEVNVA